jgi:hypothetical protein
MNYDPKAVNILASTNTDLINVSPKIFKSYSIVESRITSRQGLSPFSDRRSA